jgi:predicted small lipoprotein YifL
MKQLSWILLACAGVVVAGCGMKGPLYLPDKNASVVTRPGSPNTTTPPAQTAPAPAPDGNTTPSTPKRPQDKSDDDSQSTSSTPKN